MKTYLETVKIDIENFRSVLKSLKKRRGNAFYKEKERQIKIELDKDFKKIIKFVEEKYDKQFNKELKTLKERIEILLYDKEIEKRINEIDTFVRDINNLEIETEHAADSSHSKFPLAADILKIFGKDFETEIADMKLNYGQSGTCTAFLLRKILEKLIFLAFAKNNLSDKLNDKDGGFVGLKTMLNLATAYKVNGKPFLTSRTAKEIEGIKFLGDTSAHNPITNVKMETIVTQMPFIITAYEELSKKL